MKLSTRNDAIILGVIFILALGLRIGVAWKFVGLSSPPDLGAQLDQQYYEEISYNLAIGNGYALSSDNPKPTAMVVPGTSLTLLPVYLIFGRSYMVGRLWFCLLSSLSCLAVALAVRRCFGRTVALVAATMLALYPNHFYYAMHFVSESPYAFYISVALMFTAASLRKPTMIGNILAGVFWGAAALTRPQIVLMIPLAFLIAILCRKDRWRHLRCWSIQVAMVALMLTPWLVRNAIVVGHPVLSVYSGHTFFHAHNDLIFNHPDYRKDRGSWLRDIDALEKRYPIRGGTMYEKDQMAKRYAMESIRQNLAQMPELIMAKFIRFLSPFVETENLLVRIAFGVGWGIVGPLSLLGILAAYRQNREAAIVFLLPIVATLATCMMFFTIPRYRDSVAPVFIVFAAMSTCWIANLFAGRKEG